jgi:hypothetical protein
MAQLRLEIDETLKGEAQAYAGRYGIALADAVRILLRKGLEAEAPVPASVDEFLADPHGLGTRRRRPAAGACPGCTGTGPHDGSCYLS